MPFWSRKMLGWRSKQKTGRAMEILRIFECENLRVDHKKSYFIHLNILNGKNI